MNTILHITPSENCVILDIRSNTVILSFDIYENNKEDLQYFKEISEEEAQQYLNNIKDGSTDKK